MKRVFVVGLVALLAVACSDTLTRPARARSLANECVTRDPSEVCDRGPSIDSINPPSAPFGLFPPTTVYVYGPGLYGGTVYFNGEAMATSTTLYGTVQFDAPMNAPGTYAIYVVAPAGTTNTVYFVRTVGSP